MNQRRTFLPIALALLAALSCSLRQLGLPRIALSSLSPDATALALVRNHPEFDPPNQSLWIREVSGETIRLAKLGNDTQFCKHVAWAPDSSRVAFLVLGSGSQAEAVVYDRETKRVRRVDLLDDGGDTQWYLARDLGLADNGRALRFRRCTLRSAVCSDPVSIELPPL